ncbi:hypothetical protein JGS22_006475 [Streptomyces sp. P38-E01]|uniref:Ketosynthase family 3 (KS3) domain-containing protein n=1 Tax=Streptomyces tardus TaxID=2780544 RepID=A0A949N7T5_9ACTN|nr:beta-ketoacyl synthase N-terminal-like domain-containing protein [Streptomyces tardus]MBU7597288.1 hypothetical protein [Streptomyces tardus]
MTVVVTGMGSVSCFGSGTTALWDGLLRADQLPVPAPDDCGLSFRPNFYAGPETRSPDDPSGSAPQDATHGVSSHAPGGRTSALIAAAVAEAVGEAGLTHEQLADAGLSVGTSLGDIDLAEPADSATAAAASAGSGPRGSDSAAGQAGEDERGLATHHVASVIAARFGIGGPNHTLSTACSAGAYAVSWGAELIETGQADLVLVCGGDAFSRVAVGTLERFELVDSEHCRPFDTARAGMVTGEGAVAMVLESAESARRRGATAHAELAAHAWSCDAHHPMAPEPTGEQLRRSVADVLADVPEAPGAVVLHRAGVAGNDTVEADAVGEALSVLIAPAEVVGSAPKAVMGHTAGAAGVFGCAIAALILRHGLVPPNAHVENVDPDCPLAVPVGNPVPLARPSVLVSGTGFGGNNAVLLWRAAE